MRVHSLKIQSAAESAVHLLYCINRKSPTSVETESLATIANVLLPAETFDKAALCQLTILASINK